MNDDIEKIIESCGYNPIEKLGEGSFGIVYKISSNNDLYALKYLKDSKYNENGISNLQEIDILSRLEHPNLLHIKSILTKDSCDIENIGLITDLALFDLNTFLNYNKILTIKDKLPILFSIANGLAYLHKFDILHLDIKPDNILIFENNNQLRFVLADFGLALKTPNINIGVHSRLKRGTLQYKPFESILPNESGRFYYNNKTDIWSLGITFLSIIGESMIFNTDGVQNVNEYILKYKYLEEKYEIKTLINEHIKYIFQDYIIKVFNLLDKMLQYKNNDRCDIMDIITDDLFNDYEFQVGELNDNFYDSNSESQSSFNDEDNGARTPGTENSVSLNESYIPFNVECIDIINLIAENIYRTSSVEVLFLAYELFYALYEKNFDYIKLSITCIWLADKFINGYNRYPLDLFKNYLQQLNFEINDINFVLDYELLIIRLLNGTINSAKLFNISRSLEDLIKYYKEIILSDDFKVLKSDELFDKYFNSFSVTYLISNKYVNIENFFLNF